MVDRGGRETACPCGTGRVYAACCSPYHHGVAAPDAEALMRSRYSAYALGLGSYLLATWHPRTRPAENALALDADTRWLGLNVRCHERVDSDHAIVEFVARYRVGGGPAVRLHEVSRFERLAGAWFYVDGVFPDR